MSADYIDNKDFEQLISMHVEAPDDEEIRTELALCLYLLADNIIRAFRFKLIDRDDALQEGVLVCFSKMSGFDRDRGKAFNWFTTIILNHYRQLYRSAKNYMELKRRFLERQVIEKKTAITEGQSAGPYGSFSGRAERNLRQCSEDWS